MRSGFCSGPMRVAWNACKSSESARKSRDLCLSSTGHAMAPSTRPSRPSWSKRSGCGAAMPRASKDGNRRPGPALRCGIGGGVVWTGASAPPTTMFMSGSGLSSSGGVMTACAETEAGSGGRGKVLTASGSRLRGVHGVLPARLRESVGESRESVTLAGEGKDSSRAGSRGKRTSSRGMAAWLAGTPM